MNATFGVPPHRYEFIGRRRTSQTQDFFAIGSSWEASTGTDFCGEILAPIADFLKSEELTTTRESVERILALGLLAITGGATRGIDGSYVVRTLDGHPLPAELRLPATAGDFRLFRLEQGVLRLTNNGRFTLYFRYYHQLVQRGGRPTSTPVLSDSESGTFTARAGNLVLTPAKKRGEKSRPSISAAIVGEEIRVAYVLQSAGSQQRVTLLLRRDASFW